MILGFYQQINGRPTHFREKIKSCIEPIRYEHRVELFSRKERIVVPNPKQIDLAFLGVMVYGNFSREEVITKTFKPKRHTIRQDKSNRWKAGRKIQMVYRGPKYSIADHFNKCIPELEECRLVQSITIKWRRPTWLQKQYGNAIPPFTVKIKNQYVFIYIDQKLIGHKTLRELAINDGFDSITDFLKYFKKSIIGWKILHWTACQY